MVLAKLPLNKFAQMTDWILIPTGGFTVAQVTLRNTLSVWQTESRIPR